MLFIMWWFLYSLKKESQTKKERKVDSGRSRISQREMVNPISGAPSYCYGRFSSKLYENETFKLGRARGWREYLALRSHLDPPTVDVSCIFSVTEDVK